MKTSKRKATAQKPRAQKQVKTISKAEKARRKAKREANPQFSHLGSAVKKKRQAEFKMDAKANLLEAKSLAKDIITSGNKYENEAQIVKAKKVINVIARKPELIALATAGVRTNKNGSFSSFYFLQLVQKVVKLGESKKNYDVVTALKLIASQKAK